MIAVPDVRVFARPEDVFDAARAEFVARAESALASRGRFDVSFAGGRTPESVYKSLVSAPIDWSRVHVWFGDERCVPPVHADSNFKMANEALLARIAIPAANVHRVRAELAPERAAEEYELELRRALSLAPGAWPRFDLALLGMGPDGHTASLFPGTTALDERARSCVSTWVEKFKAFRVTLTFPVFDHAACVLFLACGADKAPMLARATAARISAETPPSGRVRPLAGQLLWFVDAAARAS